MKYTFFKTIQQEIALSILIFISAAVRIVMIRGTGVLFWPDSFHYYRTSASFLRTFSLGTHEIFHTPLFPLFLALHLWIGNFKDISETYFLISQHFLGICIVLIHYFIARNLYGKTIAWWTGLLLAIHTVLLEYEDSVLTETLFLFLLSITILVTLKIKENQTFLTLTGLTFVLALLTLTRPIALYYVIVIIGYLFLSSYPITLKVRNIFYVLCLYFLFLVPWMMCNLKNHYFFGVSRGIGLNLFYRVYEIDKTPIGANQHHVPQAFRIFLKNVEKKKAKAYFIVYNKLEHKIGGVNADAVMLGLAIAGIESHPWVFIKNTFINSYKYFFDPHSAKVFCSKGDLPPTLCVPQLQKFNRPGLPDARSSHRMTRLIIYKFMTLFSLPMSLTNGIVFIGGVIALIQKKWSSEILFFTATIAYFCLTTALLNIPEERYRLPIDGLLIMLCLLSLKVVIHEIRVFFQAVVPAPQLNER